MSTSEFYLAAAESTNPNDTWWFLGFLPIILLVAFWIAALISIISSGYTLAAKVLFIVATFTLPFLGPLIWFLFVRGKEDKNRRV